MTTIAGKALSSIASQGSRRLWRRYQAAMSVPAARPAANFVRSAITRAEIRTLSGHTALGCRCSGNAAAVCAVSALRSGPKHVLYTADVAQRQRLGLQSLLFALTR